LRLENNHAKEIFDASIAHLSGEIADPARALLSWNTTEHVFVIAHEPFANWFAKALTHHALEDVFTSGGLVRAVRPHHIAPYIAAHAPRPDVPLMLGSLFADARMSGI
jgi:hypothetical protein